jgi:hypothetical protein
LIQNCFWDVVKNGATENANKRWLKYTPTLVCHYIVDHILNVRFSNPDADETSIFTKEYFKKALGKTCQTHRRLDVDHSVAIVWRSSKRDLVSWDRMGPMLVRIPANNFGPQVQEDADPELYGLERSNLTLRDLFFRAIQCSRETLVSQINHTVIARLIIFIIQHPDPGTVPSNPQRKPIDASHLERVWLGEGLKFTRFFDNPARANSVISSVWKHCKQNSAKWKIMKKAAEQNIGTWCSHGERGIDVLQLDQAENNNMNNSLLNANKRFAVKRAEKGHISRRFLLWLLEKKQWYDDQRNNGTLPREETVRDECQILGGRTE